MTPVTGVLLGILIAMAVVVGLWYVRVRRTLADNPNLIRAGAGAVKGGVFLRLLRRYVRDDGMPDEEAQLRAAAVANALYGEEPRERRVIEYLQDHAESVSGDLRGLAEEPEPVRRLITEALYFQKRLPSGPGQDTEAAARAFERAGEMGVLLPGRRPRLWAFAREAVRFLKSENAESAGEAT